MSVSACRPRHVDTYPRNESIIAPGKCFCLFIFSHLHPPILRCSQVAGPNEPMRSGPSPSSTRTCVNPLPTAIIKHLLKKPTLGRHNKMKIIGLYAIVISLQSLQSERKFSWEDQGSIGTAGSGSCWSTALWGKWLWGIFPLLCR